MNIEWLRTYPQQSFVYRAYEFARKAHEGIARKTGEPYINHCTTVGETLHNWHLDEPTVAAGLLHDTVEDTKYSLKEIEKNFGKEVATLVNGVTKINAITYPDKNPDVETLRKFIVSVSRDLRVVFIKLADRQDNLKTLYVLPEDRQHAIAWETMEIFAPLAYRLGMQRLSGELEDLSFPYLYPEEYGWLLQNVKDEYRERDIYAKKIIPILKKTLVEHKIYPLFIDARAKRYSSLYKKLMRYDMNLDRIYDLVAIRIIVKTIEECYATLGIIHHYWAPLPNRIKDYIASPKPNGYKSLHTTVFCADNRITEFQIRTDAMHEEDELGIAAHWLYRDAKSKGKKALSNFMNKKELAWIQQLKEWQGTFTDEKHFMDSLKIDFFKDRIFVMTPKHDVIDLPVGATPIDFAYQIHSEIGNQCTSAKINGKIVPLDYELHSGDIVEVNIQRGKKPSADWLRFVKTVFARDKIKTALREKSNALRKKTELLQMEFKITNHDRPGYLKDITTAFAELKINIVHLTSQTDARKTFATVTVQCSTMPKEKIEKLVVKLKKIGGTREVHYSTNPHVR